MEHGQSEDLDADLEQWVDLDGSSFTAAPPPITSFTPISSRDFEKSQSRSTYPSSITAKRPLEHPQDWPKRQKHDQSGKVRYPGTPDPSVLSLEPSNRRENSSFRSLELYTQAETAPVSVETETKNSIFYHPTPPSTEPTLLPYPPSNASVNGYPSDYRTIPSIPFPEPDSLPFAESYQENEDAQNCQESNVGQLCQYSQDEAVGYSPSDGAMIDNSGLNHISAMHRFLYLKSSQRSARQANTVQPSISSNKVDFVHKEDEDYFDDELLEQEMAQLAEPLPGNSHEIPPSSVVRDMDAGSDTEMFDPTLQRSSPTESKGNGDHGKPKDPEQFEDDLLSSDIDWDSILQPVPSAVCQLPQPQPVSGPAIGAGNKELIRSTRTGSFENAVVISDNRDTPSNHVNRNSSVDSSLVTNTRVSPRMCTFFRVSELINEGRKRFSANQQPIFEFYAWVSQSWRERNTKVQYFVFVDLYKEDRLELQGRLSGWITNGELDKQSSFFLSLDGKPNQILCRCVCTVQQDHKIGMGWYLVIRWIRPATWGEISKKRASLS